jgi:hypothetical protein
MTKSQLTLATVCLKPQEAGQYILSVDGEARGEVGGHRGATYHTLDPSLHKCGPLARLRACPPDLQLVATALGVREGEAPAESGEEGRVDTGARGAGTVCRGVVCNGKPPLPLVQIKVAGARSTGAGVGCPHLVALFTSHGKPDADIRIGRQALWD